MSLMNGNSLSLKQDDQDVCVICIERSGIVNSRSVWFVGRSVIYNFLCVNHVLYMKIYIFKIWYLYFIEFCLHVYSCRRVN